MAQLSFLQFGHSIENDNYSVTASFNGHPGTTGPLHYDPLTQYFEANLNPTNTCETFSSIQPAAGHLGGFNEAQLAHIAAGSPLSLRGGGIIKTTKFPPPNKEVGTPFIPVNEGLLDDLYLSSFSILRNGPGQDFTVSLEIKNKSTPHYLFQISSVSIAASQTNRPQAILFVQIAPGPKSQDSASILLSGANAMSFAAPCSIVLDLAPLNHANDYLKSGWFYMLP